MDGSDDGYESYHNWPLFYALGGSEHIHEQSRFLWNSVTKQFTNYGQIYREFDGYYDWMHHGESSLYIYYFGLANPSLNQDRARAIRFAGFYMNENLALSHPELSHSVENKKYLNKSVFNAVENVNIKINKALQKISEEKKSLSYSFKFKKNFSFEYIYTTKADKTWKNLMKYSLGSTFKE